MMFRRLQNNYMTRNLEPGLEPQAHVRVRMYRYSEATSVLNVKRMLDRRTTHKQCKRMSDRRTTHKQCERDVAGGTEG
jgi:hypothetical protein